MFYLVTMKRMNMGFTSREEILTKYKAVVRKGGEWSDTKCIELDSLNRLHLHTIVCFVKKPYFQKYQGNKWHINFTIIDEDSYDNVIRYCLKNSKNVNDEEQAEWISYYNFNYGFSQDAEGL